MHGQHGQSADGAPDYKRRHAEQWAGASIASTVFSGSWRGCACACLPPDRLLSHGYRYRCVWQRTRWLFGRWQWRPCTDQQSHSNSESHLGLAASTTTTTPPRSRGCARTALCVLRAIQASRLDVRDKIGRLEQGLPPTSSLSTAKPLGPEVASSAKSGSRRWSPFANPPRHLWPQPSGDQSSFRGLCLLVDISVADGFFCSSEPKRRVPRSLAVSWCEYAAGGQLIGALEIAHIYCLDSQSGVPSSTRAGTS